MTSFLLHILTTLLLSILKIVCLLIAIAYFTLAERKIMAAVQRRVGPNVVGPFGLLQPLADGLKLAGKELAVPAQASSRIFLSVAITVLLFALSGWSAIPFGMFDHSEHMDISTTVKILLLTEPQNVVFPERLRSIDESGVLTTPRGGSRTSFDWQVTVKALLRGFFGSVEFVPTGNDMRLYNSIKTSRDWTLYLEEHGHSPEAVAYVKEIEGQFRLLKQGLAMFGEPHYVPTEEEFHAYTSTEPGVLERYLEEHKDPAEELPPEVKKSIREQTAHVKSLFDAAWPAQGTDVSTGGETPMYEGIKISKEWAAYLEEHPPSPKPYTPTAAELRAFESANPEDWVRFLAEQEQPVNPCVEGTKEELAHARRVIEAAWPANEVDEPKA